MPILEIEGVGRVEVDPSFLDKSPADQDAIIADIVAQSGPSRRPQPSASNTRNVTVTFDDQTRHIYRNVPADLSPEQVTERAQREFGRRVVHLDGGRGSAASPEPATPAQEPSPAAPVVDKGQAQLDAASVENMPTGNPDQFSDEWLAEQEAAYQRSLSASPASDLPNPPAPNKTGAAEAGALGFGDALTFGFADEIDAGLGAVLGGPGYKSIWDGDGLSAAYGANVKRNRALLDAAQGEHPIAYGAGAVAGGIVPVTGSLGAARAATTLGKLKAATATGAAYGAAYGFGSDEGSITDRLDGAAFGAGAGAVGGAAFHGAAKAGEAALSPLARRMLPKLAQAQFAKAQAGNPHVQTDARVADDLDKIVRTLQVADARKKLSKSQRSTLLSRAAELEASYLPTAEVNALDLPPSVKARLHTAMAKRHLLADEEVQALRDGTPAGEAVADGIQRARRLRAYVPESGSDGGSLTGTLAETLGSAAGFKAAGPLGSAIGRSIGRASAPRSNAKAAKSALSLAQQAPRFAQLPEVAAAREARGPMDALSRLSGDALDASYNADKAARAETARLEAEARNVSKANARDDVRPSGGYRGLIYDRTGLLPSQQDAGALAALKEGAISPEQFNAFLSNPSKLMAGNAGNALIDRLAAMAEKGKLKRDAKWTPPAPQAASGATADCGDVQRVPFWRL